MNARLLAGLFLLIATSAQTLAGNIPATETVFTDSAPSYANAESLLRRMEHGLVYRQAVSRLKENGTLNLFTVVPSEEKWRAVMPDKTADADRKGALVWIPTGNDADIPAEVMEAASAHDLAVISAYDSGDGEPGLARRAALALIGLHLLVSNIDLDPARVIVGGQGEAAEIALRLATGYADIFSGALLLDGGLVIGTKELAVPVPPLPEYLRKRSKLIFMETGNSSKRVRDAYASFKGICVSGARFLHTRDGHNENELLNQSLEQLLQGPAVAPDKSCLDEYSAEREAAIDELKTLVRDKRWRTAPAKLLEIHVKYGGPAETEVFAMADEMSNEYKEILRYAAELMWGSRRNKFFGKPARITPDTQDIF